MRIIAGEKRRMTIKCPSGREIRPTLNRVREAIFSMLEPMIHDARALDLFAGCGTLGLEALSRGAREAVFVESAPKAIAAVEENLKRLGLADRALAKRAKVGQYLTRPPAADSLFDLILVDPPYGRGLAAETLGRLGDSAAEWLNPGATVVGQAGLRDPLDSEYGDLVEVARREYGKTLVVIYRFAVKSQ